MSLAPESVVAIARTALGSRAALLEAEEQKLVSELSVVRALLEHTRGGMNELLNCNVPIMSLPNEILGEIFQTYHAQAQVEGQMPYMLPTPVILSHVAHRWRNVALSMPHFWTNIQVSPGRPLDQIVHYIIWSRGCALHIRVCDYPRSHTCCPLRKELHVYTCFMLLLQYVDRWRKIDIQLSSHETFHLISDQLQNVAAPQLETFSVGKNACTCVHDPPLRILMGGSPSLRELNLKKVDIRCCWPSLTTLRSLYLAENASSTPLTTDDFYKMMTSMPILTELKLDGEIVDNSDLDAFRTIEFASLLKLDVRTPYCNQYGEDIIPLYTILSTPALQTLILRNAPFESPIAMTTSFSSSSGIPKYPQLRNLEFTSCEFDGIPLDGDFLDNFPEVVHVSIRQCWSAHGFINLLAAHGSAESHSLTKAPLPKLHTFSFSFDEGGEDQAKDLYEMISARKVAGLPIKSLHAHLGGLLGSEPCINSLREVVNLQLFEDSEDPLCTAPPFSVVIH
jgi:hypothetical protein